MDFNYSDEVINLRKKKVKIDPIRRKGGWVPEDHDSAFMNEGAVMGIVVPVLKGDILVDPLIGFTKNDRELLAKDLGLEDDREFNVHSKKNYWRGNTVNVNRDGLNLDLSLLSDFVQYLILKAASEQVSPTWADRFDKGTCKFAIVEQGEEIKSEVLKIDDKKKAFKLFDRIDHSVEKMKDFLYVYYLHKKEYHSKRPPTDASLEWLKKEVGGILEDDLHVFLQILSDKRYDVKLLVQKAVNCGALLRDRHLYFVPGADKPIGVLEELIDYIDDPRNQEFEMKLMQQIENVGG